ncbi:GntR family transcriptional regulator [Arcobacter sp.]|uniref:GntR family transcriptional regulator n=1 Tax=Arcobacter sp. TaxID=1872629 RepID=UPI003D14270B
MFNRKGIPLYIQLKDLLLKDIKKKYQPGDIIHAESKLEEIYNVSRITVRKAIEELEKEHIVEKKQGKGTFVLEQKILYDANSIGSLTQRLSKQNHKLETKSLEFQIIDDVNHYVKDLLQCKKLILIKRLRTLNGIPFALMSNYLDYDKVPNIEKDFKIESLYSYLQDTFDIEFYNAQETIEAKAASKEERELLNIKDDTPLLSLNRLSFDKNDNPLEYSNVRIKADMYQHKINLHNDVISNN